MHMALRHGPSFRAGFHIALLATSALGAISAAPASAQQAPATVTFSIAPQPLPAALRLFAQASGIQIAYATPDGANVASPGVSGPYEPAVALARLLAGTGLTYRFTGANTATLEKLPAMDQNGAMVLPPVEVEGQGSTETAYGPGVGYVAHASAVGTKTDTPLVETPQAISVVTRQQMTDQNVQSVAQALRYTSGVVPEQRGNNTDSLEYIYSRGFQIEEYLNGLRLPGVAFAGYNITSYDPYLIDRVEVLHGPASVLYGQSSPGGLLNIDSKRATDDPLHEILLQTGSYGRAQGAVDLSGRLDDSGTLLGRLTADSFSTGTQTDHVDEKRIAIAPTVTWRPNADTSLTVFGNYQYDPQAGLYNSVTAAGTVLPGLHIPRNLDPGEPSFDRFSKTEMSLGYSVSHRFDDTWSVYQDFRYSYNRQTIQYVGVDSVAPDGTSLARESYYNQGSVNTATLDNRAQAKFSTGPLDHTLTAGVDWQKTEFDHVFLGGDAPNLSIANPQYNQPIAQPTFMYATSSDQSLDQVGLYAQEQARLGRWAFLAGLREDFADEQSRSLKTGAVTKWDDESFTWRAGLVYLFDNGIAPYVSYSTSFQPSFGTSYSGTPFQPTTGQQYEVGAKYQAPGANSFVTASLFNLTQQNVSTTDPLHTSFQIQTGEVRSRGLELEAHASITDDLQVIGTYTYEDVVNTESNTTSLNESPVGIPRNMASGWAAYDLPWQWSQGLKLDGGVRYTGFTYGTAANSFKVPSVTLVDLGVHYDLGKAFPSVAKLQGLSASVTASNLFDKDYISYCGGASFCTYGAGRLVLANLKYDW